MDAINNRKVFIEKGIKNTAQRNIVFDLLKNVESPLTAEQIFLKVKEFDGRINISTIYRILDIFVSKDLVIKSNITEDNKAIFEFNRMEHRHHLICVRCKKMLVVDNCPLEIYEKTLEEKTNYQITAHKLEIYGYCPLCREKQGQSKD